MSNAKFLTEILELWKENAEILKLRKKLLKFAEVEAMSELPASPSLYKDNKKTMNS
jgi:hypothetical protein